MHLARPPGCRGRRGRGPRTRGSWRRGHSRTTVAMNSANWISTEIERPAAACFADSGIHEAADQQEIVADAGQHHPGLVEGKPGPAGDVVLAFLEHALSGPQDVVQADGTVMALPQELHDACDDQDVGEQHGDHRQPITQAPFGDRERQNEGRQGREHQAPFDQPAQGEDDGHDGDAPVVRLVEPQSGQQHGSEQQRIGRHDVFVDHAQEEEGAAAEMEQRGQHRHGDSAGQAQHEGIDEDDREGKPRRH